MTTARHSFSATLLNSGQVLIAGGEGNPKSGALDTAEIFDPVTNSFHATGSMTWARDHAVGVLLSSGRVLVTGDSMQTEIYDPGTGTFSPGPVLTGAHEADTATLLENGSVLLAGSGAELLQVK
jgi:hypothetical protein